MIRSLAADGMTVVIIEHTMHAMVRLADQLVVLDHGQRAGCGRAGGGDAGSGRHRSLSRQEMDGAACCEIEALERRLWRVAAR